MALTLGRMSALLRRQQMWLKDRLRWLASLCCLMIKYYLRKDVGWSLWFRELIRFFSIFFDYETKGGGGFFDMRCKVKARPVVARWKWWSWVIEWVRESKSSFTTLVILFSRKVKEILNVNRFVRCGTSVTLILSHEVKLSDSVLTLSRLIIT